MKNILFKMSAILMLVLAAGCNDEKDYNWLEDPHFDNPMTMSVNSNIIMDSDHNEDLITFTWTAGNDRGPGTSLKYLFKMDLAVNDFEDAIPTVDLGNNTYQVSFTVDKINEWLQFRWGATEGVPVELAARVIAQVEGGDKFQKPEVADIIVTLTPFYLEPVPLYIVGDAAGNGWNYSNGISMNERERGIYYEYSGTFSPGEFVLITKPGQQAPGYGPAAGSTNYEGGLTYRETTSDPQLRFTIGATAEYTLKVNLDEGWFECYPTKPYETVCFGGGCIDNGYDQMAIPRLEWNYMTPNIYTWEGTLKASSMFVMLDPDITYNDSRFFQPAGGSRIPIASGETQSIKLAPNKGNDAKWDVATAGNYRMIIDVNAMTITLQPL